MKIIKDVKEMFLTSQKEILNNKKIGFVPTMGALHDGHLSLIRQSKKDNDITIVSIFVNPTQFGPNEDFNKYPRTIEQDIELLEKENVDYLFLPNTKDMYSEGFETYVNLEKLPNHLCGLKRPGHFRGVATIVLKLFNIVRPHKSYFGQKDYQQYLIIKRMAEDLNCFVDIVMMPIVRESDGLAMSSRNRYLNQEQRKNATILFESLQLAKNEIKNGETNPKIIIEKMKNLILNKYLKAKIDYIEIVDLNTLEELHTIKESCLIALAVFIGEARLIDNIIINKNEKC